MVTMPTHMMGCHNIELWVEEFVLATQANPALPVNKALLYEWFSTIYYSGYDRREEIDKLANTNN